jgi:hypothetical protein
LDAGSLADCGPCCLCWSLLLQDGALCFCRLSMVLGGPSDRAVLDLLALSTRDINAPAFSW